MFDWWFNTGDLGDLCGPPPYLQEQAAVDNSRVEAWVEDKLETIVSDTFIVQTQADRQADRLEAAF